MADDPSSLHPLGALETLLRHLEGLQRTGRQRVWMSPDARSALREIVRMKPGRMTFPVASASPVPQAASPARTSQPATPALPAPPETLSALPAAIAAPDRAETATPARPVSREESIAAVRTLVAGSEVPGTLGTLRSTMVFAAGNPHSPLMLVGEAPGAEEEKRGEPFVGPAGQLLDRILSAMGFDRSTVYITNVCKFRPAIEGPSQGSRNRPPTTAEMNACLPFLHREIEIIRPSVIVALGATAAEGLLSRKVSITRERGSWHEFAGIPLMLTVHPSYLLRCAQQGPETELAEKRKSWEDMLAVMEKLGLPISEKQRGFFRSARRS
jgi:uracil-DNA glycosylase family 4